MESCWIRSLYLHHFRNYHNLSLETNATPIILTGPNGAGKTNILEAISFLAPGRGLRKEKLGNINTLMSNKNDVKNISASKSWAVLIELESKTPLLHHQQITIGTGLDPSSKEQTSERRIVRVNGDNIPQNVLPDWVHVIWQTPQMDRLFIDGMTERRKFIDRLIVGIDPLHSTRLYRYEYALRERSRLLRESINDPVWLNTLEGTLATEGVAICASRLDFIENLNQYCLEGVTHFPKAKLAMEGTIEEKLKLRPAIEVENWLKDELQILRAKDEKTGGSSIGSHQSQVQIWHLSLGYPAEICSTGEQKALLLSIMLADCRLQFTMQKRAPLLLLDEILAHLDQMRRESFFAEIQSLGVQAWMTGTDPQIFALLQGKAQFFEVAEGKITKGN